MFCDLDLRWSLQATLCRLRANEMQCIAHQLHRYGSSANMVLTTGNGVNGYTLDPALGEFILTHPDVSTSAAARSHPSDDLV